MNKHNSLHQNRHMHTENPSLMFIPVSDIYVDTSYFSNQILSVDVKVVKKRTHTRGLAHLSSTVIPWHTHPKVSEPNEDGETGSLYDSNLMVTEFKS